MKLSILATILPLALGSVIPRADRGSYAVDGLGARKQELLAAGANTMDMAIAMLETENMGTDYKYGDGKSGDATNFGIFKQNWMMLRLSASEFKGMSAEEVDEGAVLNEDLGKDIQARHDSEEFYGFDKWCGGHRNGETGLGNPDTDDIHNYMAGITWIQEQIESDEKFQTDDTRFWVDVVPI
ncbi:hypothetical protein P168DRAFT_326474 [Aspergillus campestris IBT 28561]|uniref:Uncharacterized protein n=1 Tax=Aspergillus campestris (strain IBT 28561) TaxID=1392248 RepID=A0A2I1D455_ASPC2|nr:uncharacterized protein P168DRAFT_326474 [Aspergillus campestris IBT 28561]PKY04662.1 hypothetical protein P168DRAFT_326474 [Aspergillus campestris IBT 28561]